MAFGGVIHGLLYVQRFDATIHCRAATTTMTSSWVATLHTMAPSVGEAAGRNRAAIIVVIFHRLQAPAL